MDKQDVQLKGFPGDESTSFVIHSKSQKCQAKINDEILNRQQQYWLQLNKVLQNLDGKDIATMTALIQKKSVVVKE
jgi:hypothetical protein